MKRPRKVLLFVFREDMRPLTSSIAGGDHATAC